MRWIQFKRRSTPIADYTWGWFINYLKIDKNLGNGEEAIINNLGITKDDFVKIVNSIITYCKNKEKGFSVIDSRASAA